MAPTTEQVRFMPRAKKRDFWKSLWHSKKILNKIPGANRAERRQNWRKMWNAFRLEHPHRYQQRSKKTA